MKDLLSVFAFVISLGSLAISFRSAGFNRRTKSAELRATLLAKILEASLIQERLNWHRVEVMRLSFDLDQIDIYKSLLEIDPNRLSISIMSLYEDVARLPSDLSADAYEQFFATAHLHAEQSVAQEKKLLLIKARLESLSKPHHQSSDQGMA